MNRPQVRTSPISGLFITVDVCHGRPIQITRASGPLLFESFSVADASQIILLISPDIYLPT